MRIWRHYFLSLLALFFLSSLVYGSVMASDSSVSHSIGRSNPYILDRFAISDINMESGISYFFSHNTRSKYSSISFELGIFPNPPYEISTEDSPMEFYGNLSFFELRVNGQIMNIPPLSFDFIDYDDERAFNIIVAHFYNIFTIDDYFIGAITVDIAFQFDVFSNHTSFSENGEEIKLGTTPTSRYSHILPVTSSEFTTILQVGSSIALLVLMGITEIYDYRRRSRMDREQLTFTSIVFPHLVSFGMMISLGTKFHRGDELFLDLYLLVVASYLLLPILIELIFKNYYYDGIYTRGGAPQEDMLNSSDRSLLPNTIKISSKLAQNTKISNGKILERYESLLLRRVFTRAVLSGVGLTVISWSIGIAIDMYHLPFYGIFYGIWVYFRKISVEKKPF